MDFYSVPFQPDNGGASKYKPNQTTLWAYGSKTNGVGVVQDQFELRNQLCFHKLKVAGKGHRWEVCLLPRAERVEEAWEEVEGHPRAAQWQRDVQVGQISKYSVLNLW